MRGANGRAFFFSGDIDDFAAILLVDQTLLDSTIRINPPIAQKRPMRPVLVHAGPLDICQHDLFPVDRAFGDDLAMRTADKTLSPELDAIAPHRFFVTDAVRHCDVTPIGNGMAALDRFPRRMLRLPELFFLARMPANRRRIKNNFCTRQSR